MLRKHTGTTTDTRGTVFKYTCYTQVERITDWHTAGWPTREVTTREYVVYDGRGTGRGNVLEQATSLRKLKQLMGRR